jgi:5-(carboxyamino)imidazole ribonucleotide synthase
VHRPVTGDWSDPKVLARFAEGLDVVTLENEFIDAGLLRGLEEAGVPVFPGWATMSLTQDKLVQKQTLAAAGLPVPEFRAVGSPAEIVAAGGELGWPLVLKARRNGYDGKGNFTLRSAADVPAGWERLGGGRVALYVEAFWPFEKELAAIVTRGRNGGAVTYPVVETVQRDHICHEVLAPAPVAPEIAARAADIACRAVAAVGAVGSFGVEMFMAAGGRLAVNELAPRVHNSGHYTIEGCVCSQFENHVRAVLGWPLGRPELVAPAVVMVNLLGTRPGTGRPEGLAAASGMSRPVVPLWKRRWDAPGARPRPSPLEIPHEKNAAPPRGHHHG